MEYVAYGAVAVGAITLTVYSTDYLRTPANYVANYFASPLVLALRSLGSDATETLDQLTFFAVVDAIKETTSGACTALPASGDPTSLTGQHDETAIVETILSTEKFDPADPTFLTMLPRLRIIVQGLCLEATACANFEELRQISFDNTNSLHQDLLESLWEQLCPGLIRESSITNNQKDGANGVNSVTDAAVAARKSKSWGRIGFQGLDPVTDLRGMGLLGLLQLVHFARTSHSDHVLEWSQAPANGPEVKFFPFACASIQITHLVLQLARERLLGHVMVSGTERVNWSGMRTAEYQSVVATMAERRMKQLVREVCGGTEMVWSSINLLNDVHSEIFILLGEAWKRENPPDVMSFPSIFKSVEKNVRAAITKGRGASSLEIRWRR